MARSGTVCLLLLAALLLPCEANGCMPGLSTPGVTSPRGDIILEEGTPLRINCTLYPNHPRAEGRDSSYLTFYNGTAEVSLDHITVLNDTSVQLLITDLPLSEKTMMYCKLKKSSNSTEKVVCLNKVVVGRKPQEVKNFSCFSKNWQALTCTWEVEEHYLPTVYQIAWSLPGRAGRRLSVSCPTKSDIMENTCTWNLSTTPIYRQPFEFYYITINASNDLGNVTFPSIKFHHYAHVIPAEPESLQAHNVTAHSLTLTWAIPFPLQNFPPGLIHRVEYRHKWLPVNQWIVANTSHLDPRDKKLTLHVDNLPYAFTDYEFRVQMKSHKARDSSYSKPSILTIKTAATVPGASPKTDIGSFEILSDIQRRDVYIYWQHIPEYYHNGDNFDYKIVVEDDSGEAQPPTQSETTTSYAKIKNLSHRSHKIKIFASNSEGLSKVPSIITIPSHGSLISEPLTFTKIEFGAGVYELSWKEPLKAKNIANYTIFWCDSERDRPYQCTGFLNWTHVPANVNIVNITVPEDKKIYQFAIAANGENTSSGLSWAVCTAIHNKGLGKMKNVWVNKVGSEFIEVGWKLECSDRIGLVIGYNISYCPTVSPENRTCRELQKMEYVPGDSLNFHGNISELMPYTTYMVKVSVISRGGQGMPSDPQLATTLESAPEAPRDIIISEVTNTSIHVAWKPPKKTNGYLQKYEIHFNKNMTTVDGSETAVTINQLPSFTEQLIFVTACTGSCSEPSENQSVKTQIGSPGMIEKMSVKWLNASKFLVSWDPPPVHGGLINYYELSIRLTDGSNNSMVQEHNTTGTELIIPVVECSADKNRRNYHFSVRAVNIDSGNKAFHGPWSETQEMDNCFDKDFTGLGITLLSLFVGACTLVSLLWVYGKKAWFSVREMRDVEVELPPGLDPSLQDIMGYGAAQKPVDSIRATPADLADSEMLLTKTERHGRNPSGDSSGCSSGGHEDSISSSLTSNRQISTDSGTEVDQLHGLSDGSHFGGSSKASSSGANVGRDDDEEEVWEYGVVPVPAVGAAATPAAEHEGYPCLQYMRVGAAGSNTAPASPAAGPYSRVGEQPTAPPTGYVSLEQVARTSPVSSANGYVSHPYVWKDSSTAAPSSSSSSAASSASGSPTLPPAAAPNGYIKVGCVEPPTPSPPEATAVVVVPAAAPPPSMPTASSGYVALGTGGVPVIRRPATTSNYVPHPPLRLEPPSAEHEQSH